ncbi:MAG: ornithine cyclodeaminase family protein [Proteobacteria bacterium]|nr:ornithine cyclodeaminase family protein [Pseudomonadota bacterium]
MSTLRVVSGADVRRLLPVGVCIELMADAMRAVSAGQFAIAPRLFTPLIGGDAVLGLMPGSSRKPPVYGAKVIGLHPGNPARGLPWLQGFVVLFDADRGTPLALIEGSQLTAIRTAAASALATRVLARGDAVSHGVFGAGVQAAAHVEAIALARDVRRVLIWARSPAKAQALAARLRSGGGGDVSATTDPREAAACDIVTTVTGASEPVLRGEWLEPGAHVNLVGAHTPTTREADDEVIRRSALYVDLRDSALREAGDLLIPMRSGIMAASDIVAEIGEVLAAAAPGRTDPGQITLYKSLGIVAQDLVAADHVYRAACEQGVGTTAAL